MSCDNTQESLETFSSALDNLIREAVCEDFARERRDVDPRGLVLEDISEGFKIGVAPAYKRMAQLEGGNVGLAYDLVVGVHLSSKSMGLRISNLDFQETFGNTVHLFDRLLPGRQKALLKRRAASKRGHSRRHFVQKLSCVGCVDTGNSL